MKVLHNSLFALKLVRGACPSYFPWTLLVSLTGVTAPLTGVLGIKLLIDALTAILLSLDPFVLLLTACGAALMFALNL